MTKITTNFTHPSIVRRIAWSYGLYVMTVCAAFALGYFLLPRGFLLNTPYTFFGVVAAEQAGLFNQFISTLIFNLGFAFFLGALLNFQRVNGFPAGYVFLYSAGVVSGIIAGTNSFANPIISPYTVEGWTVAIRIQHLELLGYATIVAATINLGLRDYSSWLPWKAKEIKIKSLRDIRLTKVEILGVLVGIALIIIAAIQETIIVSQL